MGTWELRTNSKRDRDTESTKQENTETMESRHLPLIVVQIHVANNLVAVHKAINLHSPAHSSAECHLHKHSFIPISTSTTSHRLPLYPRTITSGTPYHSNSFLFGQSTNYKGWQMVNPRLTETPRLES